LLVNESKVITQSKRKYAGRFVDEFDGKLMQSIDETINYCLGHENAHLIYEFLEKKGCLRKEIPENLNIFADTLEDLVGVGRGQFLGAAVIMENVILKALCLKLQIDPKEVGSGDFPNQIKKLKEIYNTSLNHT
jgi:hypothetical protein